MGCRGLNRLSRNPRDSARARRNSQNLAGTDEVIDGSGGLELNDDGQIRVKVGDGVTLSEDGEVVVSGSSSNAWHVFGLRDHVVTESTIMAAETLFVNSSYVRVEVGGEGSNISLIEDTLDDDEIVILALENKNAGSITLIHYANRGPTANLHLGNNSNHVMGPGDIVLFMNKHIRHTDGKNFWEQLTLPRSTLGS